MQPEFHSGAVTRPLSAYLWLAMMGCPALRARGEPTGRSQQHPRKFSHKYLRMHNRSRQRIDPIESIESIRHQEQNGTLNRFNTQSLVNPKDGRPWSGPFTQDADRPQPNGWKSS